MTDQPTQPNPEAEVVATFVHHGQTYQIDHLGIGRPNQWGEFVIYHDGQMAAEFALPQSMLREKYRPDGGQLPPVARLIELAKTALAVEDANAPVGAHWRDYSGAARTLYYDGHRAGYMAAVAQIWEAQHALPSDELAAGERTRLGDLAEVLRRDYDRVKAAAVAAEETQEDHHG